MASSRPFQLLPFGHRERPSVEKSLQEGAAEEWVLGATAVEPVVSVPSDRPLFTVLAGDPTEEEVAALVALIAGMQAEQTRRENSALALWQRQLNRGQRLGERLRPGPGSWRRARPM